MEFKKRTVVTKKLRLKLEVDFNDSILTVDEVRERIERAINNSYSNVVSNFIVAMLRETSSSTWEFKNFEINSIEE